MDDKEQRDRLNRIRTASAADEWVLRASRCLTKAMLAESEGELAQAGVLYADARAHLDKATTRVVACQEAT